MNRQFRHRDDTFPVGIQTDIYNSLIDNTENYHWHNDFEFGILLEGAVTYSINGSSFELRKGGGFFVNSNALHMSRSLGSKDFLIYTLTFPASLICSSINNTMYMKYFAPLLSERIEGFKVLEDKPFGVDIRIMMMKIYELDSSAFGYELECQEYLHRLWLLALQYMEHNKDDLFKNIGGIRHVERMKQSYLIFKSIIKVKSRLRILQNM